MGKLAATIFLILPALGDPSAAVARETTGDFHITSEEKAACGDDAQRLCSEAYPDEAKLLACMKAKRSSLNATCAPVFSAGLKRRGL